MAPVRPFSALRYVNEAERRFSWGAPAGPTPGALHSGELLRSPEPAALLQRWAAQGELVAETPGLYLVETWPLSPRPGRTRAPARFLVGALELDGTLRP